MNRIQLLFICSLMFSNVMAQNYISGAIGYGADVRKPGLKLEFGHYLYKSGGVNVSASMFSQERYNDKHANSPTDKYRYRLSELNANIFYDFPVSNFDVRPFLGVSSNMYKSKYSNTIVREVERDYKIGVNYGASFLFDTEVGLRFSIQFERNSSYYGKSSFFLGLHKTL